MHFEPTVWLQGRRISNSTMPVSGQSVPGFERQMTQWSLLVSSTRFSAWRSRLRNASAIVSFGRLVFGEVSTWGVLFLDCGCVDW